jgi:hypothetical protein
MATCQIKWIDARGNPTPDTNEAVQRVRTIDRVQQIAAAARTSLRRHGSTSAPNTQSNCATLECITGSVRH